MQHRGGKIKSALSEKEGYCGSLTGGAPKKTSKTT
jgi:hypothetical protein